MVSVSVLPLQKFNKAGTQNYTCDPKTGNYSTSGTAEAALFDITELYTGNSPPNPLPSIGDLAFIGTHFFVQNPLNTSVSAPRFQNNNEFIIGKKNNTVPTDPSNFSVASVLLQNIESGKAGGTLADWVVRTNVIGGVVPSELNKCQQGDTIGIPYRADYLFFKQ